ncbi:hypothetical protein LJC58_10430 [Lachnospiraceae bacterium OttesenSCG-928-D06]|nr:hypothetical protein [Lachnospiraceae bacterium OttesenSCG-928-D06]
MFNFIIEKLFKKYKPGYEYWVNLSEIHIQPAFAATKVNRKKMKRKLSFYNKMNYCESPILLNKDFTLIDGYSSYCIYKNIGQSKIPVFFVDDNYSICNSK